MADAKVNYDPAQIDQLKSLYADGNSVKEIARLMNRSDKSIQGKLVSLGLYRKVEKAPKPFTDEPSKKDILKVLAGRGYSEAALKGLEHATKSALQEVADKTPAVEASTDAEAEVSDVSVAA